MTDIFSTTQKEKDIWGSGLQWLTYLPPVFEEVFAEDVLGGVLVLQHLGKERGHLFGFGAELHVLTWKC